MASAWFNHLMQRVISFNRVQTKRQLDRHLARIGLAAGGRVLDFGCGTGLNAGVFLARGCHYTGYDIDPSLTRYAARRYPGGRFVDDAKAMASAGPYDLIMAHCVFHHIDDEQARSALQRLRKLLRPAGTLLLIDLLRPLRPTRLRSRLYRLIEQGRHLRDQSQWRLLVSEYFDVVSEEVERSHLLSCSLPINPFYSRLAAFHCRPRGGSAAATAQSAVVAASGG